MKRIDTEEITLRWERADADAPIYHGNDGNAYRVHSITWTARRTNGVDRTESVHAVLGRIYSTGRAANWSAGVSAPEDWLMGILREHRVLD